MLAYFPRKWFQELELRLPSLILSRSFFSSQEPNTTSASLNHHCYKPNIQSDPIVLCVACIFNFFPTKNWSLQRVLVLNSSLWVNYEIPVCFFPIALFLELLFQVNYQINSALLDFLNSPSKDTIAVSKIEVTQAISF